MRRISWLLHPILLIERIKLVREKKVLISKINQVKEKIRKVELKNVN